jgi:hypothetical protein
LLHEQFFVFLDEGDWKINHNGEKSARYRTKAEAILDAVVRAHKGASRGGLVRVMVQGEGVIYDAADVPTDSCSDKAA